MIFPFRNVSIQSLKKTLSRDGWTAARSIFMVVTLKVNLFVLLRVALLVSQLTLSAQKNVKFVGTHSFHGGKDSFGLNKLLELV